MTTPDPANTRPAGPPDDPSDGLLMFSPTCSTRWPARRRDQARRRFVHTLMPGPALTRVEALVSTRGFMAGRWVLISIPNRAYRDEHTIMAPSKPPLPAVTPGPVNARAAGPADDAGGGLVMFVVFILAVLISTGAVVLIALVGTWWMLGFGFATHMIVTAVVLLTVVHVMAGRTRARAERDPLSPAADSRVGTRPQARKRPVTVP
jgi:hypothetical protein